MRKQMLNKKTIICIGAAAVVAVAAVLILLLNREEAYRSILVYDVEGSAVIERASVGSMDAVENLYLESGDRVSVAPDSGMRMKLDDDKYVMAEADTVFSVEAEGNEADSRTRICLEQGAITNEIQHPLSEGSQYETSTPNSVMAVRGTIYRVELLVDENGETSTKLCCFQGKVGTKPILPDGTYGEEVLVPAGSELTVHADGSVDDVKDITYEELPAQALQNLADMAQNGQSMTGVTLEELTAFAAQAEETGSADVSEQTETADTTGESVQSDADTSGEEEETEEEEAVLTAENTSKSASAKTNQSATASESPAQEAVQPAQPAENAQAKTPQSTSAASTVTTSSDSGSGGDSQNGDNNSSNNGQTPDNNAQGGGRPDIGTPDGSQQGGYVPPVITPPAPTYTVTFVYQGKTFATQQVKGGETVSEPLLMPAQGGAWDFDFATAITADTTVTWKENN